MRYLIAHKAEVFSYDVLNVTKIKLLHLFADHVEIINQPRHITLTHHVSIKETLMEDLCFSHYDVTLSLSVFSRHLLFTLRGSKNFKHLLLHYVLRIVIDENDLDFDIFSTI